jgi:hypothetical protein
LIIITVLGEEYTWGAYYKSIFFSRVKKTYTILYAYYFSLFFSLLLISNCLICNNEIIFQISFLAIKTYLILQFRKEIYCSDSILKHILKHLSVAYDVL